MPLSSTQVPGVRPLLSHLSFIFFYFNFFRAVLSSQQNRAGSPELSQTRPTAPMLDDPHGRGSSVSLRHPHWHAIVPPSPSLTSELTLRAVHSMGLDECIIITTFVCFCGIIQRNFTVWPLFHIRNDKLEGSSGSQWTRHSARAIAPQQFNLWETWPFLPDLLFLLTNRLNLFFLVIVSSS